MKKLNIIFLISVFIQLNAFGQIDSLKLIDNVYQLGLLMSKSFMTGDYDKFLDLTHPKIIEMSGGRDKMIAMFKNGIDPNFKFITNDLQKPDKLIITNSIVQCSLKQRQEFKINGTEYFTIGYLIGISYDLGKTWKFIGVAGNTLTNLKTYFPELSNNLDVKSQTKPTQTTK
jgi:hypothetical protein